MRPSRRPLVAIVGFMVLAGCRDREVRTYRVPREAPPAVDPAPAEGAASTGLSWSPPPHWEEKPAAGFRRGSFTIPASDEGEAAADLSITAFPGEAGGLLENINRWRGQIGLPPLSQAEATAAIEHVDGRGPLHFDVVDFAGTADGEPTRITGAVLEHGGESWFFKLIGPDERVAAQRPAFDAFLQTVRPAAR